MNAQHQINRKGNRLRRIARKLMELNAHKDAEVIAATKNKREPDLSWFYSQKERLEARAIQLREVLAI